jgi:hypothetical protein
MMKAETESAPDAPFSHLIDLGVNLARRMMGTNIRGVATAPLTALMNLDVDFMRRTTGIEAESALATPHHWRKEGRRRITPDLLEEEDRGRSSSALFLLCEREETVRERKLRETWLGEENESICGTHCAKRPALIDKIITLKRLALQNRVSIGYSTSLE